MRQAAHYTEAVSVLGACLQVDGYAVSRSTRMVEYVGNDINLDATSPPVPEPVHPIDEAR